jgi:hypothetical protein
MCGLMDGSKILFEGLLNAIQKSLFGFNINMMTSVFLDNLQSSLKPQNTPYWRESEKPTSENENIKNQTF